LLKIDIEGGEFSLLEDARFGRLTVKTIVLEWHRSHSRPDAQAWCRTQLEAFGYAVEEVPVHEDNGLMWARKTT
jgi:hypothetical protein